MSIFDKQNAQSNRKRESAHSFQTRKMVVDPEGSLLAPRRTALRVQVVILHSSAGLAHSQVRTAPQQKQIDHAPRSVRTHYYLSF
jgi:hypothetical protein